jgi:mono/diheme cytochrome c family protein
MRKLFLSLLVGISVLSAGNYEKLDIDLEDDELMEMGAKLYAQTCVSCHGVHGETNPAMRLVVKPRRLQETILSQKQMFEIIKHGAHYFGAHADIMPAFKYVYDDEQIYSLAYFISHSFNKSRATKIEKLLDASQQPNEQQKSVMLSVGKKIFQKKCAMCHGVRGDAKSKYVVQSKQEKNFIYPYNLRRTLLNEDQIFLYAKYGGHFWGADKTDMPSWSRKYDDIALKSVAKYVEEKIKQLH